jgi:hypothetical protein
MVKIHATSTTGCCSLLLALTLGGCGSDQHVDPGPANPWGNDVSVVGPDGKVTDYEAPSGGGCVQVSPTSCVPQDRCGPGVPADVVLDEQGNVIDVVCYPTKLALTPEQITAQQGNVAQNQNGAVIVLDGVPDGVDLDGNLSLDANQVIVYGGGPDVSVIGGDVTVDGNNIIVRGVRMQGNLDLLKNDSVLVFCVIEGNVRIVGNNTRLSGCDVFGSVSIEGNNSVLSGNHIQGGVVNTGQNTTCQGNLGFQDLNQDFMVEAAEVGPPIGCG